MTNLVDTPVKIEFNLIKIGIENLKVGDAVTLLFVCESRSHALEAGKPYEVIKITDCRPRCKYCCSSKKAVHLRTPDGKEKLSCVCVIKNVTTRRDIESTIEHYREDISHLKFKFKNDIVVGRLDTH